MDARRTETTCVTPACVAPRHVDAPRDFLIFYFFIFLFFLRTSSARGGGGGCAASFFFFFFPCSADHERDWPPCKVVFFGLATNALNVRNNNKNNNNSKWQSFSMHVKGSEARARGVSLNWAFDIL